MSHSKRLAVLVVAFSCLALFAPMAARCAIADDFKSAIAATPQGCENIPYQQARSRCVEMNKEGLEYWCKVEQRTCTQNLFTRQMLENVEQMKRRLSEKESEKTRSDEASKQAIGDEIERLKRAIEGNEKEIQERKRTVEKRIENGRRCVDNRLAVIDLFKYTIKQVSDENDADAKELAPDLVKILQEGIPSHEKTADQAKADLEFCRSVGSK